MAALLLAAPASAQDAPPTAKPEWPKTMYACRYNGPLEGFGGTLEFDTMFTEEGAVFSENARWSANFRPTDNPTVTEINNMVRVKGKPDEGWIIIEWPSVNSWRKLASDTDAAANATVRISNFGLFGQKMRKKERWHQSILVRNSEVLVTTRSEDRYLILSPLEPALITDFDGTSSMDLNMPVANLLAWGSGLQTLTVYDAFVEPRKYRPHSSPNGPAGMMRIVGEYQINVASLARAFDGMRAQHSAWRKSQADLKANCRATQVEDPSADIIVT